MKEGGAITGLWIPGENEREWWKPDRNGIWLKSGQAPSSGQPSGYAFSAFACHSYPLWISSDDSTIVEQIVPMELEQLGAIGPGDLETHRDTRTIDHDGARTLIQALVIPGELEGEDGHPRWQRFFPSPCLYAFPRNRIVIWKELDRFVVAFTREGRLVHFHAFGKGGFSDDLVAEIAHIYGELYGRDVVDEVTSLLTWTEEAATPEARVVIDRLLQLQVEKAEKPPPDPTIAASIELVPESIQIAQAKRKQRATLAKVALLVVFLMVVAAGFAAYSLVQAKQTNEKLRERIATQGPEAERVRAAKNRWEALSSAVSIDRHPVEVFHRIATLLPEKGILMTHFEIDGDRIIIRGEASSVPLAIRLKTSLETSPDLTDYKWTQLPPDETGQGNTAKFQVFGDYRFGTTNEG